ncbi:MAG: hypothetical protein PHD61_05670 [Bacteroidales bacterium]|nr:hypothetical protein [Lentimicrobiaceae bacterium]MDD5694774.1 hypothetical protein [Bacteroidales bacterium]
MAPQSERTAISATAPARGNISLEALEMKRCASIIQYFIDMDSHLFIPTDRLHSWQLPGHIRREIDRMEGYISQLEMDNAELAYHSGQLQDRVKELENHLEIALKYGNRGNHS